MLSTVYDDPNNPPPGDWVWDDGLGRWRPKGGGTDAGQGGEAPGPEGGAVGGGGPGGGEKPGGGQSEGQEGDQGHKGGREDDHGGDREEHE